MLSHLAGGLRGVVPPGNTAAGFGEAAEGGEHAELTRARVNRPACWCQT
jgi:hypothetical protein